jgi:hypothetical protein
MTTGEKRAELDRKLRTLISLAMQEGMEKHEVVFLLTRMLPEIASVPEVMGQVMAAYDLHAMRSSAS